MAGGSSLCSPDARSRVLSCVISGLSRTGYARCLGCILLRPTAMSAERRSASSAKPVACFREPCIRLPASNQNPTHARVRPGADNRESVRDGGASAGGVEPPLDRLFLATKEDLVREALIVWGGWSGHEPGAAPESSARC
jgi:hypothetical protein